MPSLPTREDDSEEQTNAEVIRDIARDALNATVPKEIGFRDWAALIVLLVVVTTNPSNPLALAGTIACLFIAVDFTRVGHRR